MRTLLVVLAAAVTAGQLPGQALHPNGGASVVWTRVQSQVPAGAEDFAGNAFLGQGAVGLGRLQLSVSYLQGTLNRDGAFGASRDLVEGTVMLGARPLTWLTLETGPHARAYTLSAGTQRWLFWELRARAASAFVGSAVPGVGGVGGGIPGGGEGRGPFGLAQGRAGGGGVRPAAL